MQKATWSIYSDQSNVKKLYACKTGYVKRVASLDRQERQSFLEDVDEFCKELRPIEEVCCIEHNFNDQLIPLCRKYGLLGIPVRVEYDGRGADSLSYTWALERIGMEGTGVRTFFSGHTSIGQVPIQMWGNEDQRKRYLPASTKGEKILAFGLTEPEAGSNPLEMKMTYEDTGSHYALNGVKYLISNAGIAHAIVTFAYPKGRQAWPLPSQRITKTGKCRCFL